MAPMHPVNRTATGTSTAGHAQPTPPRRTPTFSSIYRAVTGRQEAPPEVKTKAVFIPKYELEWEVLKDFLDRHFEKYNCQFTKRFDVNQDHYVVNLPEDLTIDDEAKIAELKTVRTT